MLHDQVGARHETADACTVAQSFFYFHLEKWTAIGDCVGKGEYVTMYNTWKND